MNKKFLAGGASIFFIILGVAFYLDSIPENDLGLETEDTISVQNSSNQNDFDKDGIKDELDKDDDNDNIADQLDMFDNNPDEWSDFDFDGIGAQTDTDDDNDGILDHEDSKPVLVSEELTNEYLANIQNCVNISEGTSRLICYSELFENIVEKEENNFDALELSIALSKIGVLDDCHFVSHEIGHTAFEENPDVISNLINADGTMCRGGYFHGVLASYFHGLEEKGAYLPDTYKTICDELIGSSNYQDCIHGLGHGLVHYYGDDVNSSLKACNQMSFYQNILCTKGSMMEYTDNHLTRKGLSPEVISNVCNNSEFTNFDYQQCNQSIGLSLAFHTNHDLEEGTKYCNTITNENGRKYCNEGLEGEITESEKYITSPLTQEKREKYQPQILSDGTIMDIRSPAIISNFRHLEDNIIMFAYDRPTYLIMYIPNQMLPDDPKVAINGAFANKVLWDDKTIQDLTIVRVVPNEPGIITIVEI